MKKFYTVNPLLNYDRRMIRGQLKKLFLGESIADFLFRFAKLSFSIRVFQLHKHKEFTSETTCVFFVFLVCENIIYRTQYRLSNSLPIQQRDTWLTPGCGSFQMNRRNNSVYVKERTVMMPSFHFYIHSSQSRWNMKREYSLSMTNSILSYLRGMETCTYWRCLVFHRCHVQIDVQIVWGMVQEVIGGNLDRHKG